MKDVYKAMGSFSLGAMVASGLIYLAQPRVVENAVKKVVQMVQSAKEEAPKTENSNTNAESQLSTPTNIEAFLAAKYDKTHDGLIRKMRQDYTNQYNNARKELKDLQEFEHDVQRGDLPKSTYADLQPATDFAQKKVNFLAKKLSDPWYNRAEEIRLGLTEYITLQTIHTFITNDRTASMLYNLHKLPNVASKRALYETMLNHARKSENNYHELRQVKLDVAFYLLLNRPGELLPTMADWVQTERHVRINQEMNLASPQTEAEMAMMKKKWK